MITSESKNPKAKPDEHDADKHVADRPAAKARPEDRDIPEHVTKRQQAAGVVPGTTPDEQSPPSKEDPTPPQNRDSKLYPAPKTPPNVQKPLEPGQDVVEPQQVRSVDSTKDMDPVHTPESQLKGIA